MGYYNPKYNITTIMSYTCPPDNRDSENNYTEFWTDKNKKMKYINLKHTI